MAINFAAPPKDAAQAVRDLDLDVSGIKLDQAAQPRESLNNDRIAEYADAMKAGDQFPPLTVFHDGETYWLADGFHRHYAAQHAGRKHIRCYVRQGGLRDAILWSVGANAKHGLARSDADKERAVLRLLNDEEWSTWTDRDIAKRCHVSHPYVAKVRKAHAADTGSVSSMERTYVHPKTGKPTTMKTAGINADRKTNAPRPSTNDEPSPEAGPQAEASLAGTGSGMPADREGRREGEAASADLPTISEPVDTRTDIEREADAMVLAWDRGSPESREMFLNYLRMLGFTVTESNPATDTGGNDVDRSASRADRAGQDQKNALAGQVETRTKAEIIDGNASLAAREDGKAAALNSNSSTTSSRKTNKAGDAPPPASPAPILKPLSKADQIRLLRPNCRHADDLDKCAGVGRRHCRDCEVREVA